MNHPPRNIVIDWLNTIWETDLPPSAKLVACCLRRYMNSHNDMAWPSVARVTGECGFKSDRTTQAHLKILCDEGWIMVVGKGPQGTVKYQAATPAKIAPPANIAPPQKTADTPANIAPELNKELNNTLSKAFKRPTVEEVTAYCDEKGYSIDPETFVNYYNSNGWKVGRASMKCWKSATTNWQKREKQNGKAGQINGGGRKLSGAERTRLARQRAFERESSAKSPDLGCVGPD